MRCLSRPSGTGLCPGTDPAALRLITTAVLASLVMTGVAMTSWVRSSASREPAGSQAAGLRLLASAARAAGSVSYRGVEVAWWAPGGGRASVFDVWHRSGGQALTRLAAAPAEPGSAYYRVAAPTRAPGLNLGEAVVLAMSPRLVRLLAANYVVTVTGRGWVAGRPARTIAVRRRDGRLAARFWLDVATGLPVRREVFGSRAQLVSDVTFAELTVGGGAVTTVPVAAAAQPWPDTLASAQLAAMRARGWPLPGPLPGNFTLLSAREATTASGPVVDLSYSDGLSVISVFVQRGYLPSRLNGWSAVAVGGHRVFTSDPDDLSYTWSASGFVYTIVAAVPPDTVGPVVASLPHDDSRGLLGRLTRGLHLVLTVVSP